jgi:predicted nucleic acid-binding protein
LFLRQSWVQICCYIDERLGRREALSRGLNLTGVLGILLEAKSTGLLQEIKPTLNNLISHAGFRVKKDLYTRVLKGAGE